MITRIFLLLALIFFSEALKVERNALPREIFRDDVEPKRGGKVPEAAKSSQRIELNKLDAVGLDRSEQDSRQTFFAPNSLAEDDFFQSPFSEEDYSSDFQFSFDPIKISGSSELGQQQQTKYTNPYAAIYDSLFEKPKKKPVKKSSKDTYKYVDIEESKPAPPKTTYDSYYSPPSTYEPVKPVYQEPAPYEPAPYEPAPYEPAPYEPAPYEPAPYEPAPYEPDPYDPPSESYDPYYEPPPPSYEAPVPYKPKGPVLLEKRPYEVKAVQPLPITVVETYTNFDCRSLYPGRHYADPETGCQVYHFCGEDGQQHTFECGYGTVFNEYIGTCDYKNNVQCQAGEGYIPQSSGYQPPEPSYQYETSGYQPPKRKPQRYEEPAFAKPQFGFDEEIQPFTNFSPF